ncbi:MAG: AAA family ATPase [Anaerolineales bacterium]|nr:AAA family ATPase [Anaerolineales bacterium]
MDEDANTEAPAAGETMKPEQAPRSDLGRRKRREIPDLEAIFEEVDRQAETASAEAGARAFEALAPLSGRQEEQPLAAPPLQGAGDIEARGAPVVEELIQAQKRVGVSERPARPRGAPDLFSRLGVEPEDADQKPGAPPERSKISVLPQADEDQSQSDDYGLNIPPELETYLPADLWRRLNSPSPARGVLVNALERMRSVLYLLSTFLPQHLVQEKMRRPHAGLSKGQMLRGTLLFSDVSGFTALSEKLASYGPEGAERLTTVMNRYFTTMLEILSWSGGILLKFAGDATLVYFPEQEGGAQVGWAARAGQRMLRAMSGFESIETPSGMVELRMKIGLGTGVFLAASLGNERRTEYVVLGQAVADTMSAEGKTTGGGQLVLNQESRAYLASDLPMIDLKGGFYRVAQPPSEELDDFEIKAETRRARGAIPWDASQHAIMAQIQVALRQAQALMPYLAPELVERVVVHARKRRVESEYRPTTVLFCNFSGPEILLDAWGEIGAQRVANLLDAYFTTMNDVIARYGGIVSRIDPYSKGSKMLILFGAPVAHEDDPQRAVSAALAMNAELEALDDIWRRKYARHLPDNWEGPLIQHRIGITYGQTFAGQVGSSTRREYTVMGDDVNLAARLMGAAEMGRILLSKPVYDVVADYFVLTERAPIRVKGKSKPIPIFQVEGPQEETLANRAHSRTELVGRDAELARGEATMRQAIGGRGSILVIQGPPGIGKSHLADELLNRAAASGAGVFFNQCRSYNANASFACWGAFLRSLAGITPIDYNPRIHYQKFKLLLDDLRIPAQHIPPLGALMGLRRSDLQIEQEDESASQATGGEATALLDLVKRGRMKRRGSSLDVLQQFEQKSASETGQIWSQMPEHLSQRERDELQLAVSELMFSLSRAAPLVVFFEDAHWMDEASEELLQFLEQRIENMPVLFLVSRRAPTHPEKGELGETINLEPLSQSGTTEMIAHLLVSDLAQVIHEQSLGNPLLVGEITRWFKRTHNISAEELKSVLKTSDFLQKLVLSGLENLPEAQREVARAASVIGTEFRTGEIHALLPALDIVSLSNHLRSLVRERLFLLAEAGADACYAFHQALVRDILYNSLPREQRRDLHARMAEYLSTPLSERRRLQARIAAALETVPSINPAQEVETIAHHYEQAGLWLSAAKNLLAAGDYAWQRQTYEKAGIYYGRAIQDLDQAPPGDDLDETTSLRLQAYVGQGDAALVSGDYLTATTAYEAALNNRSPDTSMGDRLGLFCKLALVLPTQGRVNEAIQVLRKELGKPQDVNNATAAATMCWLLWRAGRTGIDRWVKRCKELILPASGAWTGDLAVLLADFAGEWAAAITGYTALGKPVGAALAAMRLGNQALSKDDLARALSYYQRAGDLWEAESGQYSAVSLALYHQAEVHWRLQELETAQAVLEQALQQVDRCAPSLQAHGRAAIQRALKLVAKGYKRWPTCDWHVYDDEFRISLLYHSLEANPPSFA